MNPMHKTDEDFYYNVPFVSLIRAEELYTTESIRQISPNVDDGRILRNDLLCENSIGKRKDSDTSIFMTTKLVKNEKLVQEKSDFIDTLNLNQQNRFCQIIKTESDRRKALEKLIEEQRVIIETLTLENISLKEDAQWATEEAFLKIIKDHGGICRANICSLEWHSEHPTASKELFGCPTFRQLQVRLRCFWSELFFPFDETLGKNVERFEFHSLDDNHQNTPITEYEKCLITIMRFHRRITTKTLGLIWGRGRSTINSYIHEWAPKLGEAGLQISILDLTPEFLSAAMPESFKELGLGRTGALVDGKVIMTNECRQHNGIKRGLYNDKTHHAGAIYLNWIVPYGLTFEHTALYLGRVTESTLVALWGSCKQLWANGGANPKSEEK
jgi:hypothetical protein